MTDIVARLRSSAHPEYATAVIVSDTLREAAAEIERLNGLVAQYKKWLAEALEV